MSLQGSQIADVSGLSRLTYGQIVAGEWPEGDSPFPDSRKVLFAPATFNAVSKLALGIADTPPTTLAAKSVGLGESVLVAPAMDAGLRGHPLMDSYLATLQSWGVHLLEPSIDLPDDAWWDVVVTQFLRLVEE